MDIVKAPKKYPTLADMVPGEAFKFLSNRPAMIVTTSLPVKRGDGNVLVVFLDTAEIMEAPLTTPVCVESRVDSIEYGDLEWGDFFQTKGNNAVYLVVGTNEPDGSTISRVIDTDTGEEVEIDVDDYTPVIQLKSEVRISCYQEDV